MGKKKFGEHIDSFTHSLIYAFAETGKLTT